MSSSIITHCTLQIQHTQEQC